MTLYLIRAVSPIEHQVQCSCCSVGETALMRYNKMLLIANCTLGYTCTVSNESFYNKITVNTMRPFIIMCQFLSQIQLCIKAKPQSNAQSLLNVVDQC